MKVKVIFQKTEDGENDTGVEIIIDGKREFCIREGEPEDMLMWRDLSDAYNVEGMLQRAYLAGKNGEEFSIEYEDEK